MKILVADNSPVFRDVVQRRLARWGYDVIVACDGNQAWDCLQAENVPKVVVLDWMIPRVDGIDPCQRIRGKDHSGVYIMMLTSKTELADLAAPMTS